MFMTIHTNIRAVFLLLSLMLVFSSCHIYHRGQQQHVPPGQYERQLHGKKDKDIPPGQLKKVYHQQSAKQMAPGHQK